MPAVLALGPELIALMAIVALLAALALTQLIVTLLKGIHLDAIPFIGNAIIGAFVHLGEAIGGAASWLWQHANPFNLLVGIASWLLNFFVNTVQGTFWTVEQALQRFITQSIPNAIGVSEVWVVGRLNTLAGTVAADLRAAEGFASNLFNRAAAALASGLAAAGIYALSLYHLAMSAVAAGDAAVERWVTGEIGKVWQGIEAGVRDLTHWTTQEIGALRDWTSGEINTLRNYIDGTLLARIGAIAAAVAAVSVDWFKWKRDCGEPLCNNLGNFGNEINAIENALGDLAILGLLAAAVADPKGVSDEVISLLSAPVQAVTDVVSAAAGIAA